MNNTSLLRTEDLPRINLLIFTFIDFPILFFPSLILCFKTLIFLSILHCLAIRHQVTPWKEDNTFTNITPREVKAFVGHMMHFSYSNKQLLLPVNLITNIFTNNDCRLKMNWLRNLMASHGVQPMAFVAQMQICRI